MHPRCAVALLATLLTSVASLPAQRLIAVNSVPGSAAVFEIDPATGAQTQVGAMTPSAAVPAALAYDPATGRLFMSGASTDSLYVIDVSNWQGRLVGAYGNAAILMHGMEWDSSTGRLYGMSTHNSGLYEIDTTTGIATLIGTTGLAAASSYGLNLVYDPIADVMFMTSTATDSLYTIDRTTGVATLVGPMPGITNMGSLAYVLATQTVYGIDNINDVLYRIDTATGAVTPVASVGSTNMIGLAALDGGRISRLAHACGPTTIVPTGHPATGYTTTIAMGNVTGLPLLGFGFATATQTYCGCTIGHDWLATTTGNTTSLTIPANSAFVGLSIRVQGLDLFGSGGCAAPAFTLTDTIVLQIG